MGVALDYGLFWMGAIDWPEVGGAAAVLELLARLEKQGGRTWGGATHIRIFCAEGDGHSEGDASPGKRAAMRRGVGCARAFGAM